jgi:hypothetical protein
MADLLIAATIFVGGYLLSNQDDNSNKNKINNNISKTDVKKKAIESFANLNLPPTTKEKATKSEPSPFPISPPLATPPPSYDTVESCLGDNFIQSPLLGTIIPKNEFNHNNMQPFYRGTLKQNLNPDTNGTLLDNFTGNGSLDFKKKEIEPLFKNDRKDIGLPFGSPNKTDEMREYIESHANQVIRKNNELPFEQIRTGPGINKGYTNLPSGGFNQPEKNEILKRYMNVDELRTANNPKQTYKARLLPGKSINVERGVHGDVRKHKPDTFYINEDGKRNFVTNGAYLKPGIRSKPIDKKTNRQETTTEYYGNINHKENNANYVHDKKQYDHTMLNINQLESFQVGPADGKDKWTQSGKGVDDYGRRGIENKANQRSITGVRTHGLNLKSLVEAIISPFLDTARKTRKENMIGAPRIFGNFANTAAEKPHYYDANDKARTTTRETIGRTDYIGAPRHVDQTEVYYFDPNDIAKYTNRLDTSKTDHFTAPNMGNNTGGGTGAYINEKYLVPATNRQTTQDEYVGIAKVADTHGPQSYDAGYNARLNPNKELISKGRTPGGHGPKNAIGKDGIHVQTRKHDYDYMQTRIAAPSNMSKNIPNASLLGEITDRKISNNINIAGERNRDFVTKQFEQNPYAKPLHSVAAY